MGPCSSGDSEPRPEMLPAFRGCNISFRLFLNGYSRGSDASCSGDNGSPAPVGDGLLADFHDRLLEWRWHHYWWPTSWRSLQLQWRLRPRDLRIDWNRQLLRHGLLRLERGLWRHWLR